VLRETGVPHVPGSKESPTLPSDAWIVSFPIFCVPIAVGRSIGITRWTALKYVAFEVATALADFVNNSAGAGISSNASL
jgi:hypothetical protein